ncbi:hypothetical protein PHK61_28715 [Actinomycetospora lutea]|uniref:hypothetical protein n=1 Tax=Actinomycetospora lutea TaxID=663604 RepID=UPI0023657E83|nr:hypothetical protein [Actinomycetospora lutea]MDD7942405.1 hypothetical protein [Actinomycetospora lutea]
MSTLNLPPENLEVQSAEAAEAEASSSGCACALFAVVNADGTLARGFGATSAQRLGQGAYEVIFNRSVRNCAYLGTIGLSGDVGSSPSGEITVVGRNGNDRGVFLTTATSAGSPTDAGFHLAVHCRP